MSIVPSSMMKMVMFSSFIWNLAVERREHYHFHRLQIQLRKINVSTIIIMMMYDYTLSAIVGESVDYSVRLGIPKHSHITNTIGIRLVQSYIDTYCIYIPILAHLDYFKRILILAHTFHCKLMWVRTKCIHI